MATSKKLLTVGNLTAYNTQLLTALGLNTPTGAYAKSEVESNNPTSVVAALNDIYYKMGQIDAKQVTLTASTNTDLSAGAVTIGVGEGTGQKVTLSKVAISATSGTSTNGYVTVGLNDGALTVDDTKIKTDIEALSGKTNVVSIQNCTLTKSGDTNMYTGTLSYTDNAGASQTATISFNSADFVKDGFLESVAYGDESKGQDANKLYFTWNTDSEKTVTAIDLAKYIDTYEGDNETITVNNKVISAKTAALTVAANKKSVEAGDDTGLVTASAVASAINAVVAGNKKTLALGTAADTVMDLTDGAEAADGSVTQTLEVALATDEEVRAMFNPAV